MLAIAFKHVDTVCRNFRLRHLYGESGAVGIQTPLGDFCQRHSVEVGNIDMLDFVEEFADKGHLLAGTHFGNAVGVKLEVGLVLFERRIACNHVERI